MSAVKVFKHDQWVEATRDNVSEGDYIANGQQTLLVSDAPFINDDGTFEVPCILPKPSPIVIQLGVNGDQYITMAMDLAGTSLRDFGDDTLMLCDFEGGNSNVYSPRLSKSALEVFCKENIDIYQAFYDEHHLLLDEGVSKSMVRFW